MGTGDGANIQNNMARVMHGNLIFLCLRKRLFGASTHHTCYYVIPVSWENAQNDDNNLERS